MLLVFSVCAFAGEESLDEAALARELNAVIHVESAEETPEPKVLLDLLEKYRHLKGSIAFNTLIFSIPTSYAMAGQGDEAIKFADGVLNDASYPAAAQHSAGVSKAFVIAGSGDLEKAKAIYDEAATLAPELAEDRNKIIRQLKALAAKSPWTLEADQ